MQKLSAVRRSHFSSLWCNLQHRRRYLLVQQRGRGKSAAKESTTHLAIRAKDARNPCRDFLTFLLLFAQNGGGAIHNEGTVTVKYGIFTGNSAAYVCILAPHSQRSQLAIPARDFTTFLLFSNFSVAICTVRRSNLKLRDPDCRIRQFHRQFCRICMYNSPP